MAFTIEINRLENEADGISRQVGRRPVQRASTTCSTCMRWKEIYGRLESAADQCEDVANTIESIVLKSR